MKKVNIPTGKRGFWEVQRYKVESLENCWSVTYSSEIPAGGQGVFTRLCFKDTVIMTDTPSEMEDHKRVVEIARGNVLICGLGLGMVLQAILEKPEVDSIIVIEKSSEVIELVGPYYTDPRVTIIQADAFTYQPTIKFDVIWFDIWPDIYVENLVEMAILFKKYHPFGNWMDAWSREESGNYLNEHFRESENARRFKAILEEVL